MYGDGQEMMLICFDYVLNVNKRLNIEKKNVFFCLKSHLERLSDPEPFLTGLLK